MKRLAVLLPSLSACSGAEPTTAKESGKTEQSPPVDAKTTTDEAKTEPAKTEPTKTEPTKAEGQRAAKVFATSANAAPAAEAQPAPAP